MKSKYLITFFNSFLGSKMKQYLDFLKHIHTNGVYKSDRTGTGTTSVFGHQMRFDLSQGFPLVTTKKVHTKSVIAELLWMLSGSTNVNDLQAMGCTIWDEWANEMGELGPIYSKQWRSWDAPVIEEFDCPTDGIYDVDFKTIDQISEAIRLLKEDSDSRRILVSAWNVADLPDMALAPCHCLFQFYTQELALHERNTLWEKQFNTLKRLEIAFPWDHGDLDDIGIPRRKLSCQLYQRSADAFLGMPFNIASYALLTHMMAQQCNMAVGDFIWTGGDCHIYSNHQEQVALQLSRDPQPLPKLVIKRKPDSIFDYKVDDFEFEDYVHHPAIKADVAV
jgi:thymidylate synthase